MKAPTLLLVCIVTFVISSSGHDCLNGWFPTIGSDDRLLCIKAFVDQNFHTLDDASDKCENQGGFLAPKSTLQQEKAILESTSKEVSPYIQLDEPLLFYLGARRYRENATFYWLYDKSDISFNITRSPPQTDGSTIFDSSQNCLAFDWNRKEGPNSSLSLETTSCNCIVTSDCKARIAGFICAKYVCPPKYELFGSMCYRVVSTDTKISANSASRECKKMPGGNLATLANKKISDHFGEKSSQAAFGLRCPLIFKVFEGKIGNCSWDDGTPYEYNNFLPGFALPLDYKPSMNYATRDFGFATDVFQKSQIFGDCCQVSSYLSEHWHDGLHCEKQQFSSYICQALPQVLEQSTTIQPP